MKKEARAPKITYRGWAGHFCCARMCQFRLNTLIEYKKKKIVVSTVGLLMLDDRTKKYDTIGCERYFETMAFEAKKEVIEDVIFWDADVSKQVNFDSPWCWSKVTDEMNAQNGHEKVVEEICDKLISRTLQSNEL